MFFIRLAQAVAWIGFIFGIMRVIMGFVVANVPELQSRHLGANTSGEAIDKGVLVILVAIVIGVLAQIGQSVTKLASRPE